MCHSTVRDFHSPIRIENVMQVIVIMITLGNASIVIRLYFRANSVGSFSFQFDALLCHLQSLTNRLSNEASSSKSANFHRLERLQQIVKFSCDSIFSYQAHLLR